MKRYLYDITYTDGHLITHYDVNKIVDIMNEYNQSNDIKHTINKVKIHSYLAGRYVPKYITDIKKTLLRDVLNIPNGKRLYCKSQFSKLSQ